MSRDYRSAQKHFWHPMCPPTPGNRGETLVIERAEGTHVWDTDNNKLLDAIAGLWNVNIGHNRQPVKDAIAKQMDELAYYQMFNGIAHPRLYDLADRLVQMLADEDMSRVLFSSGGSDACETALKMARQYWIAEGQSKRTKFISLFNAYHGVHMGGTSVGGNNVYHLNHGPLLAGVIQVSSPWSYRNLWDCEDPEALTAHCIRELREQIMYHGPDSIAAFIAEPVQGAGGVIVPPPGYWPAVRELLNEFGILMIADEVVTGFGRSGNMMGSRGWGVKPDIMCLAKAISAGYVPLGATMFNKRVADAIENSQDFSGMIMHGYTYSGHPLACAAALSVLDIVEQENLPANAAKVGAHMLENLQPLVDQHAHIGEARGKGLMMALEMVVDKKTKQPINPQEGYVVRVANKVREHGVLVRPAGNKIILSPPLTLTIDQADEIVAALDKGFSSVS